MPGFYEAALRDRLPAKATQGPSAVETVSENATLQKHVSVTVVDHSAKTLGFRDFRVWGGLRSLNPKPQNGNEVRSG